MWEWRTKAALVTVFMMALPVLAQQRRAASSYGGPIPEGMPIEIRIIDSLSSDSANVGDTFHATLEQPIVVNGRTLYPKGADVSGTVTHAHRSGRLSDPGELELELTSIATGGRSYPVKTEPWTAKGESHTKSNATKIGGGAAAGAIIGAIAGGGNGAAIGAGVGAAAGTGAAAATGKKDLKIDSEAVLNFMALAPPSQYAGTPAARRDAVTSYDDAHGTSRPFKPQFTNYDRQNIRGCFADTSNLPPGLAKRDSLPPGLERQLERNGTLPPGLQKRAQPLPDVCSARLPRLPVDWSRVVLGSHVLLLDPGSRIVDMFELEGDE